MRRVLIGLVGAAVVAALRLGPPSPPPGAGPSPPAAATPDAVALAARVAELEEAVIRLELRVAELERGLAPVLEGLPEQAALAAFLQAQLDDLRARVDALEAAGSAPGVEASPPATTGS